MAERKIHGVFTALITPFKDGEVDLEGLRENVGFQLQEGVSGLLPLGTTGETPTLTRKEQDAIIRTVVEEAGGRVPVMVGTGSNSTAHTIENTRRAKELGAAIALIVTPYYNKPTQEGIYRHFKAVHDEVSLPILVYNIKGRTGVNIETPTLKRLADLKNVIGVKEASGNINQMGDVIKEIALTHPEFSVMSGDDGMTLPLFALGGSGVVSVVSNLVPRKVAAMVEAGLQGDMEKARTLHFALLPLFKAAFIETNPIPIKTAMDMAGMAAGGCRLPLCEMQPENRERLKKVLQYLEIIA